MFRIYMFFDKIDNALLKIFKFFKNEIENLNPLKLNENHKKKILKIKEIMKEFFLKIMEKEKEKELFNLIKDFVYLIRNNKKIIFYIIRFYLYTSIIIYSITWCLITTSFLTEWKIITFLAETTFFIYKIWIRPIRKYIKPIKKMLMWPFKMIFIMIKFFLFELKEIIKPQKNTWENKTECSGNWEETKEEFKRTISPTEHEHLCINNKFRKIQAMYSTMNKFKKSAHNASFAMDNSDIPDLKLNKIRENFKNEIKRINYDYPCKNPYDFEMHNRKWQ